MAKVLFQSSSTQNYSAGQVKYHNCGWNATGTNTPTESHRQIVHHKTGTLSNMIVKVSANDRSASTVQLRKNGADANQVITVTGSTTGLFEDNVNTDIVSNNDNFLYEVTAGTGGTEYTQRIIACVFTPDSDTSGRYGGAEISTGTGNSVVHKGPFAGYGSFQTDGTDSDVGIIYRTSGVLDNLFIKPTTNTRSTISTFRSRVNSANGNMSISISGGTTGDLEDTSNSDTISSDDLVNWSLTMGTGGGTIFTGSQSVDFATTNDQMIYTCGNGSGNAVSSGDTEYSTFSGSFNASSTESDFQSKARIYFTLSLMQTNVVSNSITAVSTFTLRINNADGNQSLSIPASTTGVIQDTVNTDDVGPDDLLNYKMVGGGTGLTISARSISILADSSITVTPSVLTLTAGEQQAFTVFPQFYNRFKANLYKGLVDFDQSGTHEYKIILVDSTYTFNIDHNILTQVSSSEISGTGYTAGGEVLSNFAITQNDTTDKATLTLDNTVWTNSSFTADGAIIYDNTLINKDLVCYMNFGNSKTITNTTFQLNWADAGIIVIG